MYKYYLIILVTFLSCVNKSDSHNWPEEKTVELSFPKRVIEIDSILLKSNSKKFIIDKIGKIRYPFQLIKSNEHFYFLNQNIYTISQYDRNFNYLKTFGKYGKGAGEGLEISSFYNLNDTIIIFDQKRKNINVFYLGQLIQETEMDKSSDFPINIQSMGVLNNGTVITTGNNQLGWTKVVDGNAYDNIFILKMVTHQVIKSISVIPADIIGGIKSSDVIQSPVSNPFKIMISDGIYLFNRSSKFIYYFNDSLLALGKVSKKYSMNISLFKPHKKMSFVEYNSNTEKSMEWFRSGSNLANVYSTDAFIILYVTKYDENKQRMRFDLVFINKNTGIEEIALSYDLQVYLYAIDNQYLFFVNEVNNEEYQYEIIQFDYNKLF